MSPKKSQYPTRPLSKTLGLFDMAVFVVVPGLLAWQITGDSSEALLIGCGGFVVIAVVKGIRRHLSSKGSFADAKKHLQANGFRVDMEFRQLFAVDSVGKKIAFMDLQAMSYEVYDMKDILGCEHQWVNKTTANGQIEKTQNVIVFKTRNVHQPLYKFRAFDHGTCELWLARINALLNS
ncbi:hypothetical protein J2X54_000200 [Duganella sp. 3397]|uniref:hypothetical protein n=1 Tax=Duganella sp. 3397 TaxID=2817732 RepID=UPI0028679DBA|nr:hypothetical protein [Duganella sp. 3397]MDR7047765.1 hypothetical protein [Duganella sp. 3397]